jgi:hypothetical protein
MLLQPRKRVPPKPLPADWKVSTETSINGRRVEPGTPLSITGVRGRVEFVQHVRRDDGVEWIDVIQPGHVGFRSFRPDRVRTVHRRGVIK